MLVLETKTKRQVKSENYNTVFDKTTGFFARWGKTQDEDPIMAPCPEILDLEISSGKCHNSCPFCFVPKTKIRVENDYKFIEDIKVGDSVLTFNEANSVIELKSVLDVYEREYSGEIIKIETEFNTIKVTPNHPIYTYNRGWVKAEDLTTEDELYLIDSTQTCRYCKKHIPKGTGYKRYICSLECYDAHKRKHCAKCGAELINRNNLLCHSCYTPTAMAHQHPLFKTYSSMIQRCYNSKRNNYDYYGGKGINVCDRWLHDFYAFVKDMGNRPEGYTLDRIDNSKDYCKENCRWVSIEEQRINRGRFKKHVFMYKGIGVRPSGHFVASVKYKGKSYYCGVFKTEKEAALAYNNKVKELYGERCLPQYLNEVKDESKN